jgi:hypothetical protein
MKCVNLLPNSLRNRWEWQRQLMIWGMVWCLTVALLWLLYGIWQQQLEAKHRAVTLDETQVVAIAQATTRISELQQQAGRDRSLVENAQWLELTEVPLGLLQTVIECCQRQGLGIQLDSLRIDELGTTTLQEGHIQPTRKQVLLTGLADSDPRATSLVHSLQDSRLFESVELLSIQGAGGAGQHRVFSIRCEQKSLLTPTAKP